MKKLEDLEKKIEINFKNKRILEEAFTHRSYLNEHFSKKLISNERMEFLGDSILSFWVSKNLYALYPNFPEGILTNMRTTMVCTKNLANIAKSLSLGDYLLLSKGEELGGGRKNETLLANTFEALVGAIFQDQGFPMVEIFLKKNFSTMLKKLGEGKELKDPKSLLQEKIQINVKEPPEYRVLKEEGPDHDKIFEIGVFNLGEMIGRGLGKSKQEAEESAATDALKNYFNINI